MRKVFAIAGLLLLASMPARAQSGCTANQSPALVGGGNVFGAIVSQWKQFFAAKIDAYNGCSVGQNLVNPLINGVTPSWLSAANNTIMGNNSGATATPFPLTPSQVYAILNVTSGAQTALGIAVDTAGGIGTVGTSGSTVGLLNGNKTDSGNNDWTGGVAGTVLAHTPTLASLEGLRTAAYPNGVIRDDYAVGNGALPLSYKPETGTCSANSRVNDGGSCVNTTSGDNNSFFAIFNSQNVAVNEFGAKQDNGATNDTTPIQNALNFVSTSLAGGIVVLPSVNDGLVYCAAGGVTVPADVELQVSAGTAISACTPGVIPVTLNGSFAKFTGTVYGEGAWFTDPGVVFGATMPALEITSACVSCRIEEANISGGTQSIYDAGSDTKINDVISSGNYNYCYYKVSDAGWLYRVKCDAHGWGGGIPAYPTTISAWPSHSPLGAGVVFSLDGFWVQVQLGGGGTTQTSASLTGSISGTALTRSAGTAITIPGGCAANTPASCPGIYGAGIRVGTYVVSGTDPNYVVNFSQTVGSEALTTGPALLPYGATITDGTVTEQLVGPTNSSSIGCDTGCSEVHVDQSDFSDASDLGLNVANSASGIAGHTMTFLQSVFSQQYATNVLGEAGFGVLLSANEILGCIETGCQNVATTASWTGQMQVTGNVQVSGAGYGMLDQAGTGNVVFNNPIENEAIAGLDSSQNDLIWIGNTFFGATMPQAMLITSAVSRGSVSGNNCHNATAGLSNSSSIPAGSGVNANPISGNQGC